MLDARKIFRKVTSKVNDFSAEQLRNLVCIVNLYRGNTGRLQETINDYLQTAADQARETAATTTLLHTQLLSLHKTVSDFARQYAKENKAAKTFTEALQLDEAAEVYQLQNQLVAAAAKAKPDLNKLEAIAQQCKALRKPQDKLVKQLADAIAAAQKNTSSPKTKTGKPLI
ncbi:hypothetical protein [Niabella hibiscisoli]|uniref:hypothetical protein n=1 Tax=Niabella hibiscisoli TaxID=1825928 RepID=UPI00374CDE43